MVTNNAVNIQSTGVPFFDGTSGMFTGVPLGTGQLLVGNGNSLAPVATVLTAGSGMTIVNTAGSGILRLSASGGVTWNSISSSQSLSPNNGYIVTASTLSLALATTAVLGDQIQVALRGGLNWTITQAANQVITYGNQQTTTGTSGLIASTLNGDAVNLLCTGNSSANWIVLSSQGNLNVI